MKRNTSIYLILLVTFIVYNVCESQISSDDIKFNLLDLFKNEAPPQEESLNSNIKVNAATDLATNHNAFLADLKVFNTYLKEAAIDTKNYNNDDEHKKNYESMFLRIRDVMGELLSINDSLEENQLFEASKDFKKILREFVDPSSKFQEYPELVSIILLKFSGIIESFMNTLKSDPNAKVKDRKTIPCLYLDIVEAYFKPTLFYRLNLIDVMGTQFNRTEWYTPIKNIYKAQFKLGDYAKDGIKNLDCITEQTYDDMHKMCRENKYTEGSDIASRFAKTMCGLDVLGLSSLEDKLGIGNKHYFGDSNGSCAIDYFTLVRHRLELYFMEAYNKVLPFCDAGGFENKTYTESGWMTIRLVAVYIEKKSELPKNTELANDTEPSKMTKLANKIKKVVKSIFSKKLNNPYVKFIVEYPSGGKNYTVKIKESRYGWIMIDETLRFDEAPANTLVQVQIWNQSSSGGEDIQLFEMVRTLKFFVTNIMLESGDKKYKLYINSVWRRNFDYETFALNKFDKVL